MAIYHLLNGDCLAEQLAKSAINQYFIVFRECLMEGDVSGETWEGFWQKRSKFISESYSVSVEAYDEKTVREIEKIQVIEPNSEVNLWFENDLFCQVNMWFLLHILSARSDLKIYRIFPENDTTTNTWTGFGLSTSSQLEQAYQKKIKFELPDLALGKQLWEAYQANNFALMQSLSATTSPCFSLLPTVCQAHFDRFPMANNLPRPHRVVKELIQSGLQDFAAVFQAFSQQEGIYGFGDLQLQKIYQEVLDNIDFAETKNPPQLS